MSDQVPVATTVVILPNGSVQAFWEVDRHTIAADGTLQLFDQADVHATFAPGDWQAVGAVTIADGARLNGRRDGERVSPGEWQGIFARE